jgi:cobalt/nickel transport protein
MNVPALRAVASVAILGAIVASSLAAEKWQGVDETVVSKIATEAGHPPRTPYINTDQGDLLLFLFLVAGATGGFIAGYSYRTLFPAKGKAGNGPARDAS